MKIQTLKERSREHLQMVLETSSWDLDRAAHLLQVPVARVRRMIEDFDLRPRSADDPEAAKPASSPKEVSDENQEV